MNATNALMQNQTAETSVAHWNAFHDVRACDLAFQSARSEARGKSKDELDAQYK